MLTPSNGLSPHKPTPLNTPSPQDEFTQIEYTQQPSESQFEEETRMLPDEEQTKPQHAFSKVRLGGNLGAIWGYLVNVERQ